MLLFTQARSSAVRPYHGECDSPSMNLPRERSSQSSAQRIGSDGDTNANFRDSQFAIHDLPAHLQAKKAL